MEQIKKSIEVWEELRKHKYRISVEDGTMFELCFATKYYHHLAGFQHLTDYPTVAEPRHGTARFYSQLRAGAIKSDLSRSSFYHDIEDRLVHFNDLLDILSAGSAKLIVAFDRGKASSEIRAKYHLFKREGNPLYESATYCTLFIGHDVARDTYYPATYVVEHSPLYIRNQVILECTIEHI